MNSKQKNSEVNEEFISDLLKSFSPNGFSSNQFKPREETLFLLNQYVSRNPGSCAYLVDLNEKKYAWFSDNVREILGWPANLFMEKGAALAYENFHPDELEMIHAFWNRAIVHIYDQRKQNPKNRILTKIQNRFRTPAGEYIWIRQQNTVLDFVEEQIAFDFGTITQLPDGQLKEPGFEIFVLNSQGTQLLESGYPQNALPLGKREMEILRLASEGLNASKTAEKMNISVHTVYQHRKNILEKLQVRNIAAAVAKAIPPRTLG